MVPCCTQYSWDKFCVMILIIMIIAQVANVCAIVTFTNEITINNCSRRWDRILLQTTFIIPSQRSNQWYIMLGSLLYISTHHLELEHVECVHARDSICTSIPVANSALYSDKRKQILKMAFLVNGQNVSVVYIDINAMSLCLDLNIFQRDECVCSKFGLEVEHAI